MQRTRLNILINNLSEQARLLFGNPWRRIALNLIALLSGIFSGTAVITTYGQAAGFDLVGAAAMLIFNEVISRFVYSKSWVERRSLGLESLNLFKVGVTFSLFIEAFKLGS